MACRCSCCSSIAVERALDAEIGAIARAALPGDNGQGAVRSRIEQHLLAAQGDASGSGFMPALSALAQALGNSHGATLQALSYRDGGLDLKLRAGDAESLERVDQALRGIGWQAELTSGGAAASGYEGRIQMRRGGRLERPLMEALLQYYARLSAREQRIALGGIVAAAILLLLAILLPLQRHVGELQQRVERKRGDLLWLRSMAPQLSGLRNSAPPH